MILENLRRHWLVVALLALASGLTIGAYSGYRSAMAFAWMEAVMVDKQLADEATRLYESGNPREARQAVAAYLRYLEAMHPASDTWRPGQHPWLHSRMLAYDRMLAAGRLALVEERAAETSRAEFLWEVAAKHAQDAEQPDVSRAALELIIGRLGGGPAKAPSPRQP